jgi:pseudaminic acid cytidylyltransferase
MNRIAVIPARGGSKRIPRKNIRPFAGRPMIAHAIDAALASELFSHVVVTTDDDEIASLAAAAGAEVPFRRPGELADDHTPTVPVVAHAVKACESIGWSVDAACCIYPGVPFLEPADLVEAWALLVGSGRPYCLPVAEFPSRIQRGLRRASDSGLSPFFPEHELTRTQDLDPAFHDAGQFYWGWKASWLTQPRLHSGSAGYVVPSWRVVDIDTPDDWERAERLYRAFKTEPSRP